MSNGIFFSVMKKFMMNVEILKNITSRLLTLIFSFFALRNLKQNNSNNADKYIRRIIVWLNGFMKIIRFTSQY